MAKGARRKSLRQGGRLVVVSNRLPFMVERVAGKQPVLRPGSGGLITALLPTLRDRGGTWIGWSGIAGSAEELAGLLRDSRRSMGFEMIPVELSADEVLKFYQGFSNEIIWPLFHDLQSLCNFDPSYWQAYQQVNRRFAEETAAQIRAGDFLWVHDYHLMNVGAELRGMGVKNRIGFFLHIPFPPLDIFVKLPWRFDLLRALLEFDLIGFQTMRDRSNFLQCLRTLVRGVHFRGKGQVLSGRVGKRRVRIGHFPIGIDFKAFKGGADRPEVSERAGSLRKQLASRQLILGLDRLDYTKGIPLRLEAFRHALLRHPELINQVTLIQVVIPSREDIPRYQSLKTSIEQLVGQINGQFTRPGGWVPIHYVFRSLARDELLSFYRTAEIALVTPLKDGMNLVAKEYCACSIEEDCVLILSEFAGAAAQLHPWALLTNPYDVVGMADTIAEAFHMRLSTRRRRMRAMRRSIRRHDVFWWVDLFLRAAFAKNLDDFPLLDDYVPKMDLVPLSV
jgi:trehalose 6-phosphate synthase/phosphatase